QLLPVVAEQLQWMPFVNSKLHMPVIKFIYWSIRQLDTGMQHATMASTMRRLGEEVFKGVSSKGRLNSSPEQPNEGKPKSAAFFKSSFMPLRFLSTLIVLKTVTQGKHHFLDVVQNRSKRWLLPTCGQSLHVLWCCVTGILSKNEVDKAILKESTSITHFQIYSLQPFLEACSNESFFRTCSVLLRTPKLDLQILEKLCVILQKLSRIKSNKKMFELFTLHIMIQELQRTTHPDHAFLCINLNSILFNLGLARNNSLASSPST
ncbi:CC138 protein, partial [Eudromia elegans]|nr:CC138 protein [Eudromia elegans]